MNRANSPERERERRKRAHRDGAWNALRFA